MRILAWTVLALLASNLIVQPFVHGKPRMPYGVSTWMEAILAVCLHGPLIGRVLGWW